MRNRFRSCVLTGTVFIVVLLAFAGHAIAQHIVLANPSLEGTSAGVSKVPQGWIKVAGTPDILPGVYNIGNHASAGKHYEGLHSGPAKMEAIGQHLPDSLKAGLMYKLSFDMAYVLKYLYENCYGNLAIFGGDSPADSTELLWTSGVFTHQQWKRYEAVFTPKRSYKYISFWAYPTDPCVKTEVGVALLLDNFSPTIEQVVKAETSSTPSCNNQATGTATIRLTGARQPVRYQWTPGNYTTAEIRDVPAGIYQVTATAANGIVVKKQITVGNSDLAAAAKVSTASCYNDDNSRISLTVSGGMPPYRYTLNGHPSDSNIIEHVKPGDYALIVSDQQLCADTFTLKVQPPPPLTGIVTVRNVACEEDTSGMFVARVQGGKRPYLYRVNGGNWQPDSVFRHLKEGAYPYEVKDANACSISGTARISIDPAMTPAVHPAVTPASCGGASNGEFVLHVSGGVPPYEFRMGNGNWQTDSVFRDLQQGIYTYEIRGEASCHISGEVNVTVDPARAPAVNVTVKPASCSEALNGQLIITAESGKPPYRYRINSGAWQTDHTFSQLPPGTYYYEVEDAARCGVSGSITITSPFQNCLVIMPSAFSPNHDGNNDVFRPKVYDEIHDYHIRIFNRWGAVIYEGNDPGTGWDGVYKGTPQDPQTYIYVASYTDRDHVRHDLKGTVTLVR
ncbi:gliding motility-associated C-terminal domain-containing protein [uncultured Chitinophaga sp.]|uniref:T9SS type B sorting domain-containing protein n=1 Tax=uncultured Chitinophaga sp. TaxID=339340 RepID=UPI0026097E3D|nr:gliding motility-associated C-terminal domain-containing protein [uncultured Chitinophaga sp.]